jgi:hypothetical protein
MRAASDVRFVPKADISRIINQVCSVPNITFVIAASDGAGLFFPIVSVTPPKVRPCDVRYGGIRDRRAATMIGHHRSDDRDSDSKDSEINDNAPENIPPTPVRAQSKSDLETNVETQGMALGLQLDLLVCIRGIE